MKKAIFAALASALILGSALSFAEDVQLGVILVSDGGTGSNVNTNYGSATCSDPEVCGAFQLSWPNNPISVQCPGGAIVAVGRVTTDAGIGVYLADNAFLQTDTGKAQTIVRPDGGSYYGGVVSIAPFAGAATATCKLFYRNGRE